MSFFAWIAILYSLTLTAWPAAAAKVEIFSDEEIQLDSHASLLVEEDSSDSIEKIMNRTDWKEALASDLGFIDSAVWMKFEVVNHSAEKDWVLSYENPMSNLTQFYTVGDGRVLATSVSGTNIKRSATSMYDVNQSHKIVLPKGKTIDVFVKIWTTARLRTAFALRSENQYFNRVRLNTILFGCYMGCVIAFLVYSLLLFMNLRKKVYLYYSIFLIGMAQTIFIRFGYWDYYLSDYDFPNSIAVMSPALIITVICALVFTAEFLQTKKYLPKIHQFLKGVFYACIGVLVLLPFVNEVRIVEQVAQLFMVLGTSLFLYAGALRVKQGSTSARFYLLSWTALVLSAFSWLAVERGLFPRNFFTTNNIYFGQFVEMFGLSAGVSLRFRDMLRQKLVAERSAGDRDRMRNLLRVLSHDLANPLTVVYSGMSIMMEKTLSPERMFGMHKNIFNAAKQMRAIIENVKHYSIVSDGKMDVRCQDVSPREMKTWVNSLFSVQIAQKNLKVEYELSSNVKNIRVDPSLFWNNIMSNLISNAIKFSFPDGTLFICVKDVGNQVRISVRDEGLGMPEEILNNVFDPEAHTSRVGTSGEKGTGYGMPIVKDYVNLMDGEIEIFSIEASNSIKSHGTEVVLYFPVEHSTVLKAA